MPAISTSLATYRGSSVQGTFSASRSSPRGKEAGEITAPLPFRICLRADLYPREYFPDLTTRARREEMDSDDLVAFDFLVGAMVASLSARRDVLKLAGVVLVLDDRAVC